MRAAFILITAFIITSAEARAATESGASAKALEQAQEADSIAAARAYYAPHYTEALMLESASAARSVLLGFFRMREPEARSERIVYLTDAVLKRTVEDRDWLLDRRAARAGPLLSAADWREAMAFQNSPAGQRQMQAGREAARLAARSRAYCFHAAARRPVEDQTPYAYIAEAALAEAGLCDDAIADIAYAATQADRARLERFALLNPKQCGPHAFEEAQAKAEATAALWLNVLGLSPGETEKTAMSEAIAQGFRRGFNAWRMRCVLPSARLLTEKDVEATLAWRASPAGRRMDQAEAALKRAAASVNAEWWDTSMPAIYAAAPVEDLPAERGARN